MTEKVTLVGGTVPFRSIPFRILVTTHIRGFQYQRTW